MITVKYERYSDDYHRHIESKTFSGLGALADWLFEKAEGRYEDKMFFVNPDNEWLTHEKSKLRLDSSCISLRYDSSGYETWILQINKDGKIIYSTGRFTNGISHWNEEVKQWLRDCRDRQKNPTFNFG